MKFKSRQLFGQPTKRRMFLFLIKKNLDYIFTSFLATSNTPNSSFIWALGELLFKMGWKFVSLVCFTEFLDAACGWNCLRDEGLKGAKKLDFLIHKILYYNFLKEIVRKLLMILHYVIFNRTTHVWMWKFYFSQKKS